MLRVGDVGLIFVIIGLIGCVYFGGVIDHVRAEFSFFPMSVVPPQSKISPMLKKVMKGNETVPVVVVLTAPTTMSIEQQKIVLSELSANGFHLTMQIMDVSNALVGEVPSKDVYKIAKNPYVKEVLYDGYLFKEFSVRPIPPDEAITQNLKQIGVIGVNYTGKGVTVILIDSGIDEHHPWFKDKVVAKYEIAPTPPRGWTTPHGTHCAGIILNVAPDVKFVDIVAIGKNGEAKLSWILKALDLAYNLAKKYHPCVCSCSWGAYPANTPEENVVRSAVRRLAEVMPVVFAGGNFGPMSRTIACPADVKDVIAVGAIDSSNHVAWFSSRGPDIFGDRKPNVVAPGVDIVSAKAGGGLVEMSGTSMACPFVSGVVALMLQKDPNLSDVQCLHILESTAKDLGPKGWDPEYGYGLVNASKALGVAVWTPSVSKQDGLPISIVVVAVGVVLILIDREVVS